MNSSISPWLPSTLRFVRKAFNFIAPEASWLCRLCFIDLKLFSVLQDGHPHAHQCLTRNNRLVAHGCVHTQKGKLVDRAATRNDNVRSNHHVVVNYGAMANMIAAPKNDVVA